MSAWATGARRMRPTSALPSTKSAAYRARPATFSGPSTSGTGTPIEAAGRAAGRHRLAGDAHAASPSAAMRTASMTFT